jgi:hypothetical protein
MFYVKDFVWFCYINSKEFTVEQVAEYQWPLDKGGESLMIQEQVSEYLGVKSFKRKYPDLKRRTVEAEEKTYLREKGLVTESMCDLGNFIFVVMLFKSRHFRCSTDSIDFYSEASISFSAIQSLYLKYCNASSS